MAAQAAAALGPKVILVVYLVFGFSAATVGPVYIPTLLALR
jgi:hypothetical protein